MLGVKKAQLLRTGGRLAKSVWLWEGAGEDEREEGGEGGSRKGGGERCDDQVVRMRMSTMLLWRASLFKQMWTEEEKI